MAVTIDLSGKVALITGASQGIGAEIARTLHSAGASVWLNHPDQGGGQTRDQAEALAAELNRLNASSARVIAADVSDHDAVKTMMSAIKSDAGGLDILINNAGIIRDRTVAKMSLDEWRAVIDVNLSGVFHCCKFGLEIMRDGGAIVNMGSLSALVGFHGQANYSATKAGVQAIARVLSKECARRSIRVNSVAPGAIDTAMLATVAEAARAEMLKQIPLQRLGTPREVAQAVLFLCSPLASYITGHTLQVNGGWRG
ncbi:MAG TPA: SDR family NAD(P)-dependent oxidoreductase [Isosphaeraceae bacterium]|jgi:3-oxoacyl-[acyl-carrier protein] reductase|nr:SDR family NAD(P)-dependent oxidoreductase [Isosphaeraceae bacterium]